ncbi:MAG: 5-(carboxyamino)imidazole ribonucleotide synthase [Beijerinckiaceae bacterium]|nr:5-(carboxyamino)imidazole ribonucleotide synthase [Beijerinckiaceae bacterium]
MILAPGSTIGILGGGQLGRMLALAAARLGLRTHILAPEADSPAFDVAAAATVADYADLDALSRFAAVVDVVTYEFENVPVESVRFLERTMTVRPGALALEVAQDRLAEKRLARSLGARTADFHEVQSFDDLTAGVEAIGFPSILKTTRLGYDGKGQAKLLGAADLPRAFGMLNGATGILEAFVPFRCEVSVVATRGRDGAFTAFAPTENEHRNHILHRSCVPAALTPAAAEDAIRIAQRIGEAVDYVGTFAVEFFVIETAAGEGVVVNEIAPRVHNSGHWTMDCAVTCQFEQHIRAVAGWPLGDTASLGPAEMINLVGQDAAGWMDALRDPQARLHLYGKREIREGRKMGHVNRLLDR